MSRWILVRAAALLAFLALVGSVGFPISPSSASSTKSNSFPNVVAGINPIGTKPHSTAGPGHSPAAAKPADAGEAGRSVDSTLPLGTIPLGTDLSNQFEAEGILFSGQQPFITDDASSSVNPTISGTPIFNGTIEGSFVTPGTTDPSTVNEFSLSVGYIDNPGSVIVTVLGSQGQQLGVLTANQYGFDEIVSNFVGAASFIVSEVSFEDAGWEINSITFSGSPTSSAYLAMGDSYSSGEGTSKTPTRTTLETNATEVQARGLSRWPSRQTRMRLGRICRSALTCLSLVRV